VVDGDESSWVLSEPFFNFLGVECFRGARESFIQGLHLVAAVTWKANYENSERYVAAHFLAAHSFSSCIHPLRSHFFSLNHP
jgi:hypothetical protein